MGELIDRSELFAKLKAYTKIREAIELYRYSLPEEEYERRHNDFEEVNGLLLRIGGIISRTYSELRNGISDG